MKATVDRRAGADRNAGWVVIAFLVLMLAAFVAGRATDPERFTIADAESEPVPRALPMDVRKFHDATEEVTCWLSDRGATVGLACLPDQWLASARIEADAP